MTETDKIVNEIEEKFLISCSKGDLKSVVNLYHDYYLQHKSFYKKVLSFLELSKLPSVVLNPHCQANLPFRYASYRGHADIVHFLLNDKHFIRKIPQKELIDSIATAISVNNTEIIKIITPFVVKDDSISTHLQKGFLEACSKGYVDSVLFITKNFHIEDEVENLYEKVEESSKYFFGYTCASLKDKGFITACKHNQFELVEKMLNDKNYLESSNKKPTLIDGLGNAIANNNVQLAKYLNSKITNRSRYFHDTVCLSFVYACNQGHIDIVKSLLEDSNWMLNPTNLFNESYHSKLIHYRTSTAIEDGFVNAFEQAKFDIVQYLTNSPKSAFYFDVQKLNEKISSKFNFIDDHIDIMRYLIFDLGFKKTNNHINFSKEINELFEKKNLQEQLNNDLNYNNSHNLKSIKQKKI